MSIEAMKLALEALDVATTPLAKDRQEVLKAQTALRTAIEQAEKQQFNPDWDVMAVMAEEQQRMAKRIEELEQAEKQEPVAWRYNITGSLFDICPNDADVGEFIPLYTAPPKREWVGLTYKERCELWNISSKFSPDSVIMHDFAKDIEQALKEKNT